MNIDTTITELFKNGAVEIKIGVHPKDGDSLFLQCAQGIEIGAEGEGNNMMVTHQVTGKIPSECLESLVARVASVSGLNNKPEGGKSVIKLPPRN